MGALTGDRRRPKDSGRKTICPLCLPATPHRPLGNHRSPPLAAAERHLVVQAALSGILVIPLSAATP